MTEYSELNLMGEELKAYQKMSFLGRIVHKITKSSTVMLKMYVPIETFARAEIFCQDVRDLSEVETNFSQKDLINMLYHDFLTYGKKNPDPRKIHSLLVTLHKDSGLVLGLEQGGASVFNVVHRDKKQNLQELIVPFRSELAARGEYLLADVETVFPDHGFKVEQVLEYLYCDFINKYRKGDNQDAIKTILKMLEEEDE